MKRSDRNRSWSLKCLRVIMALFTFTSVLSQAESLDLSLEEIMNIEVDTVTKTAVELAQAPSPVTLITRQDIQKSFATSIPELLRQVAGVNVRWNTMVQTIDMRGFGQNPFTNRVLLLIDGIPYNSWNKGGFPQHPGLDFFPIENVKQIEVVKGPGSAIYGENAYWGVINIKTLSGLDVDGMEAEIFGGERDTRMGRVMFGGLFDDGSYLVSAKRNLSQLPSSLWRDDDSDIRANSYFAKVNWLDFTLSAYRYTDTMDETTYTLGSEYNTALNLPPTSTLTYETAALQQAVNIYAASYDKDFPDQDLRLSVDVSHAARFGSHCASCHSPYEDLDAGETGHGHTGLLGPAADHGSQDTAEVLIEMNLFDMHRVVAGVDYRKVDAGEHSTELGDGVLEYEKAGIYLQDQFSVLSDTLHFTAGVRHDLETSPELFDSFTSPRVAAVYRPNKRLSVRTGFNVAYHYPDFSMLYQDSYFYVIQGYNLPFTPPQEGLALGAFEPNPNLEPEKIRNVDLGFEYLINENFLVKVDLFRSVVSNFIVNAARLLPPVPPNPNPPPAPFEYVNHPDDAIIVGADIDLRIKMGRAFDGFINYSVQHNSQDGSLTDTAGREFEFVYSPRHKFNVGLNAGPFYGFSTNLSLSWKDEVVTPDFWRTTRNTVNPNNPLTEPIRLESHTLVNARVNYAVPLGGKNQLDIFVKATDLLDEAPRETVVGFNTKAPGREVFAGIEFRRAH